MRFSGWLWRRMPRASRAPAAEVVAAGLAERGARRDDVEYATLCDGQVVAVPRSQPAGAEALVAAQDAAERRLRARLRESVRERDDIWSRAPWRAA